MKIRLANPTIYEWLMLGLLFIIIALMWMRKVELEDLTCRVARMETLSISAEPLPDCESGRNPDAPTSEAAQ